MHAHTQQVFDLSQGVVPLPTTLRQEVPASCSQPITAQKLTMKVPLRKSHVGLYALDSSHDSLCFFLPVNARNPLKEQWWGYNGGKQCKDGPSHCSLALLLKKCPVVELYS